MTDPYVLWEYALEVERTYMQQVASPDERLAYYIRERNRETRWEVERLEERLDALPAFDPADSDDYFRTLAPIISEVRGLLRREWLSPELAERLQSIEARTRWAVLGP